MSSVSTACCSACDHRVWSEYVVHHRYGHSLVQCGPKLVSFGGWDGNKPRNDVMCLDLSSMMVDEGPVAEGSQIESQEP